jgi:hypothetical protein
MGKTVRKGWNSDEEDYLFEKGNRDGKTKNGSDLVERRKKRKAKENVKTSHIPEEE